jgi:DNA-binding NarL/FixJ family response regulator
MLSIDKLKFRHLIRELTVAEICEFADELGRLKAMLSLESNENHEVDQTSDLTKDFLEQTNGNPPQVRKHPEKPFRMTQDEKTEILERWACGETQITIAKAIGRSVLTIGKFIRSHRDDSCSDNPQLDSSSTQ